MPYMKHFISLNECVERIADDIAICLRRALEKRGEASLAVSGGRTPQHIFPILGAMPLAWDKVSITLADERWVDADDPDSNEGLARRLLLQGPASKACFVGLKTPHAEPFDGQDECEANLGELNWPLDAMFLGMGEDGHIASLFTATKDWIDAPGRALGVNASQGRQARMSLTPRALLESRQIFLFISGPDKRATFDAAMEPGLVEEFPVRLILHQDQVPVTLYVVD